MFCLTLHIYILVITTHLLVTGIGWFKKFLTIRLLTWNVSMPFVNGIQDYFIILLSSDNF